MEYVKTKEGINVAFCLGKYSNEWVDSSYSLSFSQMLPNFQSYFTVDVLYIEIMQTRTKSQSIFSKQKVIFRVLFQAFHQIFLQLFVISPATLSYSRHRHIFFFGGGGGGEGGVTQYQ